MSQSDIANVKVIVVHPLRGSKLAHAIAGRAGVTVRVLKEGFDPVHSFPETIRLECPSGTHLAVGGAAVRDALLPKKVS